ncbi:MAG: DoxX family protein [Leptospiraceae bacterium]|nr:DoxX family protein [Leptospiraceae bacterium]
MSKIPMIVRYLMGLIFFVFGLNGFLHFIDPGLKGAPLDFIMTLVNSGYLMTLIKITEIIVGVMLLANLYVPLALVMIAPISLNIFLFHAFLEPQGLPVGIALVVFNVYLGYVNRSAYAGMLKK